MKTETIYLAGPVSNMPDLNRQAFADATRQLRGMGYIVRNPHEICAGMKSEDWCLCLRKCVKELMDCDILLLLAGWDKSVGARLEIQTAKQVDIRVMELEAFILKH